MGCKIMYFCCFLYFVEIYVAKWYKWDFLYYMTIPRQVHNSYISICKALRLLLNCSHQFMRNTMAFMQAGGEYE